MKSTAHLTPEYREYLLREYVEKEQSTYEIALDINSYANRVRRDLIYFGIELRSKSKAQANALKRGRHKHPTRGIERDSDTKLRISEGVAQAWSDISKAELSRRVREAKKRWSEVPEDERKAFREAASEALREAARSGSKLEKFIWACLRDEGYNTMYHMKHMLSQENLELDLYLPDIRTAIEVDGPTHFQDIWEKRDLSKIISADARKTGLLLNAGCVIIRIKHSGKTLSQIQERKLWATLKAKLEDIKKDFPKESFRFIQIGDEIYE